MWFLVDFSGSFSTLENLQLSITRVWQGNGEFIQLWGLGRDLHTSVFADFPSDLLWDCGKKIFGLDFGLMIKILASVLLTTNVRLR